jgi:hypothetical protein
MIETTAELEAAVVKDDTSVELATTRTPPTTQIPGSGRSYRGDEAGAPKPPEGKMITAAADSKLNKASELARTSLNSHHHSNEDAWQQASALALVSIAKSLESIVTTFDREQHSSPASNGSASPHPETHEAQSPH